MDMNNNESIDITNVDVNDYLLIVSDLHVEIEGREILSGVNVALKHGTIAVLFGPNGCGKSTLIAAIMGLDHAKITQGTIFFDGYDITNMSCDERARMGLGILFQNPPAVHGLRVSSFLSAMGASDEAVSAVATKTSMNHLIEREINKGFSGGEIKRSETLQLLLQDPIFCLLDEPESGVDVENLQKLGRLLSDLLNSRDHLGRPRSALIITHTGAILDFIDPDVGYVMNGGVLQCSGNPRCILRNIRKAGYSTCASCTETTCTCMRGLRLGFDVTKIVPNVKKNKITISMNDDDLQFSMPVIEDVKLAALENTEHHEIIVPPSVSGEFLQVDNTFEVSNSKQEGVEVLDLRTAVEKYDWVADKLWTLVDKDKDYVTKGVYENEQAGNLLGYVIIAHEGVHTVDPVVANLHMDCTGQTQFVHNILIAKKGATLHIVSGCTCGGCSEGEHFGISEFFIEEGASMGFTMIHAWTNGLKVWPRSVAHVADYGHFMSNYVCIKPVDKVQMYPTCRLDGRNSTARFTSVLVANKNCELDTGARAIMNGENSSAQIVSRGIALDGSEVLARAHLVGNGRNTKGHIECQGIIFEGNGSVKAVPQIDGNIVETELSHEASVGRIGHDKVQYLMCRGLTEDQATSAIVRGFLDIRIVGMPASLQREIDAVIQQAAAGF
ncbi:hypothetical protein PCE1_001181 [Barthelona sp. PCE]